jgi:hypothetical protein
MKRILFLFPVLLFLSSFYLPKQRESYYQKIFAENIRGRTEVVLDDNARVDIVTDTFAIEVDFSEKWAESVGQSLYYAEKLNKRAGVLLVVDGRNDGRYIQRLMTLAIKYDITVWIMDYNSNEWTKVDVVIDYIY